MDATQAQMSLDVGRRRSQRQQRDSKQQKTIRQSDVTGHNNFASKQSSNVTNAAVQVNLSIDGCDNKEEEGTSLFV